MNKQKWQGITLALMISLFASTTFASINANVSSPSPSPAVQTVPGGTSPSKVAPSSKPSPSVTPGPKATACPKTPMNQKEKPFMLDNFKVIANTLAGLGVDEAELTSYIKEGKKLEDVLKIEKISTKKFKKCIIKEYNKVVDEAVKNKQLTCEQGKQLKIAIKQTIKNWLPNNK